jgi:hypothetical protein
MNLAETLIANASNDYSDSSFLQAETHFDLTFKVLIAHSLQFLPAVIRIALQLLHRIPACHLYLSDEKLLTANPRLCFLKHSKF